MNNELTEEKKKLLRAILSMTGYVFAAIGAAGLIAPSGIADLLLGGDIQTGYILSGALIMVGITDIVIAHTIFKEKK
ncbi:MAG: hypothetical protein ACLFR0_05310 [Alphaproteobacteria bacterium]